MSRKAEKQRKKKTTYRIITTVILICALDFANGCASLRQLSERIGKSAKNDKGTLEYVQPSKMDSLIVAIIAVDTLVMEKRSKGSEITHSISNGRMPAPASLELVSADLVNGFRVQIASSKNRKDLEQLVERVEREFEAKSHIEFFSGSWSLRLGDCQSREEAESLRQRAMEFGFRHAWVVQAKVPKNY